MIRSEVPEKFERVLSDLIDGRAEWPLLVIGSVGTGKTYAACSVLDRYGGVYHTAHGLCEKLIIADDRGIPWQTPGEAGIWRSEQLWRHIDLHPVIVVDELGVRGVATPTQRSRIQEVLDRREGKPLILISNFGLEELTKLYDERVISRAARGEVLYLSGPDRRIL